MLLSFLQNQKHKQLQAERQLEFQIERSESAFRVALEAEQRGDTVKAEHFYRVALGEEAKAFK